MRPLVPHQDSKAIRHAHFRLGHAGRQARTVSGCLNSALLGLERNRPAVVTSQFLGEPASALLCSCFAAESLAQTAPLSRATNLHVRANRVPPCGFVQEPVPEKPQTLAVKPSSAQGPSGTGFFLFSTTRPSSASEKLVLYKLVRAALSGFSWRKVNSTSAVATPLMAIESRPRGWICPNPFSGRSTGRPGFARRGLSVSILYG